jgi:hypothetical protein
VGVAVWAATEPGSRISAMKSSAIEIPHRRVFRSFRLAECALSSIADPQPVRSSAERADWLSSVLPAHLNNDCDLTCEPPPEASYCGSSVHWRPHGW